MAQTMNTSTLHANRKRNNGTATERGRCQVVMNIPSEVPSPLTLNNYL